MEVLDHWVRTRKLTWRDVADGLRAIGLQRLANEILNVYKTGILRLIIKVILTQTVN